MKKIILSTLLTCSLISAQATIYTFDAMLTGPNESPANASPGLGFTVVTYDNVANTLRVEALFAGLTGTTTASHIHAATTSPFTGTAGVATTTPTFAGFPLGVTTGSYNNLLDLTQLSSYNPTFVTANGGTAAGAQAALVSAMFAGRSYLNIHTTTFPNGEIRGFLTLVPEPSTFALLGLSGFGLAMHAKRKKLAIK